MILDDVKAMSDDDLNWTLSVVSQEIAKRKEVADIPAKIDTLNRDYLTAVGTPAGAAWVQPTGAHDAYPEGWEVEYGGKKWVSLTPANVWKPGVSGWREKVVAVTPTPTTPAPAPAVAAWIQPTGGHDAYPAGAVVTHGGKTWKSTAAANVWAPGVYGWEEKK